MALKRAGIVCTWGCAALGAIRGVRAGELQVVSVSPPRHSLTAMVNTPISITFDRPVQPATILSGGSFWAFGRWSGTALGSYSFSDGGATVTLTPLEPFSAGETVMVILSHNILATDGSPLRGAGYSYQFWTRTQPAPMDFVEIGRMSTRTTPLQTSRAYGGIASDLNHDRFTDITIVNEVSKDLRVFLNRADSTGLYDPFLQPTFPVGNRASPSEPSDFNLDGHVDICVANINDDTVSVLLGLGDGTFGTQQIITVGGDPRGIAVLDADGDGDTDIVNTNYSTSSMCLIRNDGNGVFGAAAFFDGGTQSEWALSAADMNDDGILDLVLGGQSSGQIVVRRGNGDGTFSPLANQTCGGLVWMLNTGDLNGDGAEDVAVVNSDTNNAAILLNNGSGGLNPPQIYATDPFPLASDVGDLDGDGDLDWITASYSGDWRIHTNDGQGSFSVLGEVPAPIAASCSLCLDFDRDGDLDLALIDEREDVVILMKNSGTTLPVPALSAVGTAVCGALLALSGAAVLKRRRRCVS
ncbi:MAG: VCBS repeat-containing protein [Planctomycetes bacterium]|nr:VCBS repeat-containing protein [Planctomycetota bacterium]